MGLASDDDDHYSTRRVPTPWVSSGSQPLLLQTMVCRRLRQLAYHQDFSHHTLLMLTFLSLASAQSTAHCGFALMKPFHPTAKMIGTGATHGVPYSLARQADWPLSFLTFTKIGNLLPNCWNSRLVGLLLPALHSDQRSRRQTDKLQIHLHGSWHVICKQEGVWLRLASSPTVPWRRTSM